MVGKKQARDLTPEELAEREAENERRVAEASERIMVYQGRRLDNKGKKHFQWAGISAAEQRAIDGQVAFTGELGKEEWYSPLNLAAAHVGGVYRCYAGPNGNLYTGGKLTPVYLGRWGAPADVMEWQARDRTVEVQLTALKRQGDDDVNEALKALEPLRAVYQSTNYLGRLALEALLLEYLRRRE